MAISPGLAPFFAFLFIIVLLPIIGIAVFAFWLWMLIDCIKRHFPKENDKIIWVIIILLLHALGATIYYFAVKRSWMSMPGGSRGEQ